MHRWVWLSSTTKPEVKKISAFMLPDNKPWHQMSFWATFDWLWNCDLEMFERLWGRWAMMNSFLMSLCPSRAAGSCCNHKHELERKDWLFPDMTIFSIVFLHISHTHDVWILLCNVDFMAENKLSRVPGHLQWIARGSKKQHKTQPVKFRCAQHIYCIIIIYLSPRICTAEDSHVKLL